MPCGRSFTHRPSPLEIRFTKTSLRTCWKKRNGRREANFNVSCWPKHLIRIPGVFWNQPPITPKHSTVFFTRNVSRGGSTVMQKPTVTTNRPDRRNTHRDSNLFSPQAHQFNRGPMLDAQIPVRNGSLRYSGTPHNFSCQQPNLARTHTTTGTVLTQTKKQPYTPFCTAAFLQTDS